MKLRNVFLVTVSLVAALASAQHMDAFDYHVADMLLLQDRSLQKSLGVTDAQRTKMNVFAGQHQKQVQGLAKELGSKPTEAQQETAQRKALGFLKQLKQNVLAQLSAKQLQRLREVTLQAVGPSAMADSVVAAKVGISADQIKRIRTLVAAGRNTIGGIERNAAQDALKSYQGRKPKSQSEADSLRKEASGKLQAAGARIAPQLRDARTKTESQILALLTSKQRGTWKSLVGR